MPIAAPGGTYRVLPPNSVLNNASYAVGSSASVPNPPVAAGSMVALFAQNANDGSTVLSSAFGSDGKLVTTLAGTKVTFNGIEAPLFYSTPTQVGAQVPVELADESTAVVQFSVGGQASIPTTILIGRIAPGIFTLSQDGRGAAAILHSDNITPVTPESPASPGEVVILYCTGLGPLNPALATGAPSTGNRTTSVPTAQIDGVAAEVRFSGASPGFCGSQPSQRGGASGNPVG
jgi:uncharacterized protein (TIGR03437 family)